MPNFFNDIVVILFIWLRVTYMDDQRQEMGGMRQGVGVRQGINRYEVEVLILILIWMSMEGAELPHPIQAVQDPQEGLEQYYQRLVCGHMR